MENGFFRGGGAQQSAIAHIPRGVFWFGWIHSGGCEAMTAYTVSGGLKRIMCLLRSLDFTFPGVVTSVCLDFAQWDKGRREPTGVSLVLAEELLPWPLPALPMDSKKDVSVTQLTPLPGQTSPENWTEGKKEPWIKSQSICLSKHRVQLTLVGFLKCDFVGVFFC